MYASTINIDQGLQKMLNIKTLFCLFVLEFYSPVNLEVMSSRSVNSALFLGRLIPSKWLTSIKRGRPRQLPLGFDSQNHYISVKFSRLPKDRTLEREDRWKT